MLRLFIGTFIALLTASSLQAQVCRSRTVPIDMQVQLYFDEEAPSQNETTPNSGAEADNDATNRVGGVSGSTSSQFSSIMQIRVQLQDSYGANLQESSPNSEGKLIFRVCSRSAYRLLVFGPNIEEALADNVDPSRGERLVNIGLHYKKSKNRDSSATMIAAKRLQVPSDARRALEKGNVALSEHNLQEARTRFEKAIELYPDYDQAYNNLGVVLMESGQVTAGRQAFEKAISINDRYSRALINLAKLDIEEKHFEDASGFLSRALSVEPFNAQAVFLSAQAAWFSGKSEETIAFVRKLHTLQHQDFAVAHYLAAKAYLALDRHEDAVHQLEAFLAEGPSDPNVSKAQKELAELKQNVN